MKNPMKFYAITTMVLVLVLVAFVVFVPQKLNLTGNGTGRVSYLGKSPEVEENQD